MRSVATLKFWRLYQELPSEVRQNARRAYQLWLRNPRHPSLQFKKVQREQPVFSARVGIDFRALCILEGDTATWFWIGHHKDYEELLK
jgi:hypothetical protein